MALACPKAREVNDMGSPTQDRRFGLSSGIAIKAPCELATTANITLSDEQSIDGTTTDESRVVVKDQSDTTENGIYLSGDGAWIRDKDANGNRDLVGGTVVYVTSGSTLLDTFWKINGDGPITIGTDAITWSSAAAIIDFDNTTQYELGSSAASATHAGIITGHVIKTNYLDGNRTAGSGSNVAFNGTTTSGKAGQWPAASNGIFHDADGKEFDIVSVNVYAAQFGAIAGADSTTAIQAAINRAQNQGGGEVYLRFGSSFELSSTIVINARGVVLEGSAPAGGFHDIGGEPATTGLKWTGSAGGTMLQVTAVSGASNQTLRACGVKKIKFDANAPVHANGTVTLDSGGSGSVDGITVNSIEIMSGAESFDTDLSDTATNVATNINANTSSPNYYATSSGAVVTISAAIRGTGPNTFVVVSSTTTIATTDVDLADGVTDTSAAKGLEVLSTSYCDYSDLGFRNFTDAAFLIGVVATLGEARDPQHNRISNIQWEHFVETGACLRLEGDATANASVNLFENLAIKHFNGVGIDLENCDNNTFIFTRISRANRGAGKGIIFRAGSVSARTGRYNNFIHWAAQDVIAEGTDVDTFPSHDNTMWMMDFGNGITPATLGTAATVWTHSSRGVFMDHAGVSMSIAASAASAVTERDNMVSETLRIHNNSSNHARLTNGTEEWSVAIDGSNGNLKLLRIAGTGHVEVSKVDATDAYYVDDTQVVKNRRTGWAATTGSLIRTNFDDSSLTATSQALRALITDLKAHGLINTS